MTKLTFFCDHRYYFGDTLIDDARQSMYYIRHLFFVHFNHHTAGPTWLRSFIASHDLSSSVVLSMWRGQRTYQSMTLPFEVQLGSPCYDATHLGTLHTRTDESQLPRYVSLSLQYHTQTSKAHYAAHRHLHRMTHLFKFQCRDNGTGEQFVP